MSQFEELFAHDPDLQNAKNRDDRFKWVIVRLDFASDGSGGRKLVLGATPSPEEEEIGVPSSLGTGRMTYAERQRLRYETERLDEKRAQNIAAKSDKARKAFLAHLQERRKLEQLKAAARQKRIEEERAERREARALQKRLKEEKSALYRTNEEKRGQAIAILERERAKRDEKRIRKVMEEDRQRKLERKVRIEDAIQRKRDDEAKQRLLEKEQADRFADLEKKREGKIVLRREAQKERERKYLVARQQAIDELSKQKQLKAERKAQYLYQKSAERAKRLKEDHDKAEEWERLEDQRTQAELKREHDRNMMMLAHIADLKQRKHKEDEQMRMKKETALERRRAQEKAALDQVAEENRRKAEVDERRARAIAGREAQREQRNQEYVELIRNQKTQRAQRGREKQQQLNTPRDKTRPERAEKRRARLEQEQSNAELQKKRDAAIQDRDRQLELEAAKMQKRLAEKEAAQKAQEDTMDKNKQR